MTTPKKLPFPLSYVTRLVFSTDCGADSNPPALDSGGNLYVVSLTPEQVLKFTSALQAGYDLLYPDEWQTLLQSWLDARSLVNTLSWYDQQECLIVTICDVVAGCISTSSEVQDALETWIRGADSESVIQQIIQQTVGQNGFVSSPVAGETSNDLDCAYGALTDAYELVLDAWLNVKAAVDSASALVDLMSDLASFLPNPSKPAIEGLQLALEVGTALYDAWINSQTVADQWVCGTFDVICAAGEPYTITKTAIDAGFNAMTNAPVIPLTDVVQAATQYGALMNYWSLRTNDTCSDDWQGLCGCEIPIEWEYTYDFEVAPDGWAIFNGVGSWVSGVGFRATGDDASIPGMSVRNYAIDNILRPRLEFEMYYQLRWGNTSVVERQQLFQVGYEGEIESATRDVNGSPGNTYSGSLLIDRSGQVTDFSFATVAAGSTGGGNYAILKKVVVRGSGVNPYG